MLMGEGMNKKEIKTKLKKKQSPDPEICTYCGNKIEKGTIYHLETGVEDHLHSLLARKFCNDCYSRHGEQFLLRDNKK